MSTFGKEQSMQRCLNSKIEKIIRLILISLLGFKLMDTVIIYTNGDLFSLLNCFGISTIPYVLALSFSIDLTKFFALILVLILIIDILCWILFYNLFVFHKEKRNMSTVFLILLNVLDMVFFFLSIISSFSIVKLIGVVFCFIIIILLVCFFKSNRGNIK